MKTLKIIVTLVALVLIGTVTYYFVSKNTQPILEKTSTEAIEYKEVENELLLLINGQEKQRLSLSDYAISALSVSPNAKKFITNLDVDFDGQNDVGVFTSTGYAGVNNFYDFYIYNPKTKQLEKQEDLSNISNPIAQIEGRVNEVIISTYKSGPYWYSDKYFHFINGEDDSDYFTMERATAPNQDDVYQYYKYQPTRVLSQDMPMKKVFSNIVNDTEVDISVIESSPETGVLIIEEKNNTYEGDKVLGPVYITDVMYLSIVDVDTWKKQVEDAKENFDQFQIGNMSLKQEILYGVTWNYYDFFDGYDGGYLRTFFIEKDGYILNFAVANEIIETTPDLTTLPKIQFLKKLSI